jgi:hypothetical protein
MKTKGLILISFAWAMEIVGVAGGMVNSTYTTWGDHPPHTLWAWLPAIPMLVLAVAELGRVPLASVLFHRSRVMQAVALVGIVVLGYLAVENWTFGFERIAELRLKPVSAAGLLLSQAEAHQADLISQRGRATTGGSDKREELHRGIKDREDSIKAEAEAHQKNLEAIREACRIVREQCMVPRSKAEDQRYDAIVNRLTKERDDRQSELDDLVKTDRGGVVDLDKEIAAASDAVVKAKTVWQAEVNGNQVYRLAASYFRVNTTDVTDAQFAAARWVFSTFSAIAVALAGSVAALVYYATERTPGAPLLLGKLIRARRDYYARKRKKIYRDVPVEKIIYRDGKEPPAMVEKEVVRWVDRIVLIPRWGLKYPIHANSLVRDDNVTQIRKAV